MFKIKNNILTSILNVTVLSYEIGGIIGGNSNIITHFEYDNNYSIKNKNMYVPNIEYLNEIIFEWKKQSVELYGVFHTHPIGQTTLSNDDIVTIKNIMMALPKSVKFLYFPIVIPNDMIYPYVAKRDDNKINIYLDDIDIIENKEV